MRSMAAGDATERESLLLRGVLDMCVLTLLDREPMHAYAITQRLADHGFEQTGYGTVYPLVTRLRRSGLLDQRAESGQGGPIRQVLSLTAEGRSTLTRWHSFSPTEPAHDRRVPHRGSATTGAPTDP